MKITGEKFKLEFTCISFFFVIYFKLALEIIMMIHKHNSDSHYVSTLCAHSNFSYAIVVAIFSIILYTKMPG